VGGAVAGGVVGSIGALVPVAFRVAVGTALALVLVVVPLLWLRWLPQIDRETDQDLLGRGPVIWALANGFLLGTGVTSRIGYWIFYLLPVGCFVAGSTLWGAVVWATYGFTRLGSVVLLAWSMRRRPTGMLELSTTLLARRPALRRASGPITAVLALALTLGLGL
jgi:hypothetical protein